MFPFKVGDRVTLQDVFKDDAFYGKIYGIKQIKYKRKSHRLANIFLETNDSMACRCGLGECFRKLPNIKDILKEWSK